MKQIESEGNKALNQAEHNPDANAKRVIMRYQNPNDGEWYNYAPDLTPVTDYDVIEVDATSANVDTLTFKLDSSPVRTITVNYTGNQDEKISDDLESVSFA